LAKELTIPVGAFRPASIANRASPWRLANLSRAAKSLSSIASSENERSEKHRVERAQPVLTAELGDLKLLAEWSSLDFEPPAKALEVPRLAAVNTARGPQRFLLTQLCSFVSRQEAINFS
jgi:hypothetical protein